MLNLKALGCALLLSLTWLPYLAVAGVHTSPLTITQLTTQLATYPVIQGELLQKKLVAGLPMPLVSEGKFTLAQSYGLLWQLETPFVQRYRINQQGVALWQTDHWQLQTHQGASQQQNRLLLAVLAGDYVQLSNDFELSVSGTADQWQLLLIPKTVILKKIFSQIRIQGGEFVNQVRISEVTGDVTELNFNQQQVKDALQDAEQHAFTQ
ncbi:outer membrane lipoprotein carrier protein LolA [Thiopseudomonas alkaliphila]|uniref:Outer membrane lipoprotein carrier protein LolA n=1 Tax=Thiopseudomonas alkaliphila TaxID=1697053 RepID=A0AAW7DSP8_9GAMM|nr:outer membrane lipoprotein carrier protein LolA [Thiopseudomonas alkaliphila]MDM1696707.1 outer membrane lipoprotein carrier protein LolA [Thiopseudomonas alkaliphila]